MTAPTSVAVLGGGMLGLALAWRLAERDLRVTVLEAAPTLGGLTRHTSLAGVTWDRFYHVIDGSDQALLELLDELGLIGEVQWRTTRTLLFDGQRHHRLDNALDYLRLPVLSIIAKLRVGLNIVYAGARGTRGGLELISAERWLTRWSGRQAYEGLWAPLLRSKLGTNYERVSAAYIWSVIRRFYGAREGSQRTERFGFVPGGYARIIACLSEALDARGVTVTTACPVESVTAKDNSVAVVAGGQEQHFDRVITTFAAPLVVRTCPGLSAVERSRHAALAYQGVVCLSLLLDRPLGGAYMTYITDNTIPFTTVIEMTALTGTEHFGGQHLVYLPRYVPSDDPFLAADDDAVRAEFLDGLRRLYPDFDPDQVRHASIDRARHVMTLPRINYSADLPALETSVPGLYVCNSAHIVDASLSVTEAVALANKTVAAMYARA